MAIIVDTLPTSNVSDMLAMLYVSIGTVPAWTGIPNPPLSVVQANPVLRSQRFMFEFDSGLVIEQHGLHAFIADFITAVGSGETIADLTKINFTLPELGLINTWTITYNNGV